MKLTTGILLAFLIPTLSFSQAKKDTKVIVHATDTAGLFNRVLLKLIDLGYGIEQKDAELKYAQTAEKSMKSINASKKIRVVVKDNVITMTGFMAFDFEMKILGSKQERTFDPISYTKGKTAYTEIWDEMVTVGREFGTLSFGK